MNPCAKCGHPRSYHTVKYNGCRQCGCPMQRDEIPKEEAGMSQRWSSRGKSVTDLVTEREANLAYMKHLDPERDAPLLKRLRQRNTHIGNRIQKLNERKEQQ